MSPQPSSTENRELPTVALSTVTDAGVDALFDHMREPESVWIAAVTPNDPDERPAFDAHMTRVRSSPDIAVHAVTCDGQLVGSIATLVLEGQTEVTSWIEREAWRRGIASRALGLLVDPAR